MASPADEIKDHYTVLVIGSGYGGAIAASRLARAGQQVCVLERGREFQTGEFPDSEAEALSETQADLPSGHTGSHTGLYDFRISPDVNVFVGCGLGGTSLINGNIALRPDARVFEDARWPEELRGDLGGIEQGYRRAEEMLRPTPYPARYPALAKLLALEQSAAHLGRTCVRPPIAVNFEEGVNAAGILQHACILCGDCISGCNYGAKNTLAFNYLPDARRFGAEIYTQVSVRRLERRDGRWLAHYRTLETGFEDLDEGLRTVSADMVVLAAGTLGSTEILLRSKAGLPLSDQVGEHFSGNGDALGFSYECAEEIRGVGYGRRDPRDMEAVGPCVTGMIDMRDEPDVNQGIVIQDLATPGALAGLLPDALAQTGAALGRASGEGLGEALAMEAEIESLTEGPYETNADRTQAYLVTTHERGAGTMRLADGRLEIEWPHVGEQSVFQKVNATLADATDALGGKYLINPVWSAVFKRDLITLHPLGGCVMAGDAEGGVVNHKGQVFAGARGTAVHEGLYVCDGSTVPRSLGVGPLLTISALSERACALLAQDRGWRIDYSSPPAVEAQVEAAVAEPLGIQFGEVARGDGWELHLTVVSDDLDALIGNPAERARVAGYVQAPLASSEPLKVVAGEFGGMAAGHVVYSMTLSGHAGRTFYLQASKEGAALEVTLHDGNSGAGSVPMKTVLHLSPGDFERQLSTLRVSGAPSQGDRLRATVRFGQALAGDLYAVYGSMTEQRKKRPLRVNAPSIHRLPAGGRLLRYEGGSRGPVLLVAGAGISPAVFTIDTVETNLVEFLFAHRYDVWLLDAADGDGREAALMAVKTASRAAHVHMWSAEHAPEVVELNAATRDAVPEEYRDIAILGSHAAYDLYPGILTTLADQRTRAALAGSIITTPAAPSIGAPSRSTRRT
ncbi:MAG: GMC family oxidoreductase N-terminal domain-containing protein [Bryobacteraceae bacterium]